jgi:pimeloyl-ACP methyl ester carboxylesterase
MTASTETRPVATTAARMFAVPAAVRLAYRLLDRVAPAVGARWAERVWMTLPKARAPIRPAPEPGTPFEVALGTGTVAGQSWEPAPARPAKHSAGNAGTGNRSNGSPIYLVHGWAGYGDQLAAFVPALVAAGHRVVAFDMPSHGRSSAGRYGPRSSSIPEFAAALSAVVAVHGTPHAVIAHSMGANATAVAVRAGLRADRLVLLAPMAGPGFVGEQLAAVLGFGERTHRRLTARIERRVGAPMSHFELPAFGRTGAMPPTLLMHDRDDRSTPVDQSTAIADGWPGSQLHLTTGLGHNRLLRDPDVVARAVDFVTSTGRHDPDRTTNPR